MASFFERFKGRREPTSAEIAKQRLKLVLVSDRSNLSPEKLGEMQAEIIGVIKRYIEIDETEVEIKLEQRDRKNYLVADIPLHRDRSYEALTGLPAVEPAVSKVEQPAPDPSAASQEEQSPTDAPSAAATDAPGDDP
jgi:cell division topological specificity factor